MSTFLFRCSQGVEERAIGVSLLSSAIVRHNVHVSWSSPEVVQGKRPKGDHSAAT